MRTIIVVFIGLLAVELAWAQDVIITKSPAVGFSVGIKKPGSRELANPVLVQEAGTVVENGRKLYRFVSEDGGTTFYTPIPPGGGNNMKKPDGAGEAIGNGLIALMTMNAPVTKIEQGGRVVPNSEYAAERTGSGGAVAAPATPPVEVQTLKVAVCSFEDTVDSKDDLTEFLVSEFDENGKLKQSVFLQNRDRFRVAEVHNHHEIASFWYVSGDKVRDNHFGLYAFRGTRTFATLDPNGSLPGRIIALTIQNLTPSQLAFVRAGRAKRAWIKAQEMVGREPSSTREADGDTSLLGVR